MEQVLGRKLLRSEVVHHKDGNGLNNDPENLEVMTQAEHRKEHPDPHFWSYPDAIELRKQELTYDEIAKQLGVSYTAIARYFKRHGHTWVKPRVLKFDREEAFKLFKEGVPITHIAKRLNVTAPSIDKALRKAGLKP